MSFQSTCCWLALRLSDMWEFIDNRDIDKHVLSMAVFYGTVKITSWSMAYAVSHSAEANTALIIAAVSAPYMALQAAAISFYFKARTT